MNVRYMWLRTGDQLVAHKIDPSCNGMFYKYDKPGLPVFVGGTMVSPFMPGAYYTARICSTWCCADMAMFSSRIVRR